MEYLSPYLVTLNFHVSRILFLIQSNVLAYYPELPNFNRFQQFLLLNAVLLIFCFTIRILSMFTLTNISKFVNRVIFNLPFAKKKINQELGRLKQQISNQFPEECKSQLKSIPYSPTPLFTDKSEKQSLKGFLSGSRYPQKKHSDFVLSLAKQFSYSNPLHYELHPHVKQMEVQVIKMCAKMLKFEGPDNQAIGGFFSGGTESILMAILAYREYGYNIRGIKNPNLLICVTGHAAALKACDYFKIEARLVKMDKGCKMDVGDMKSKMDSNTIAVYTSFPNYPYGTTDPIDVIGKICSKRNVPVHVDMCLGGFLVPFLKKQNGQPFLEVPKGVTSISMDSHKYGLSAKGASVLLFSDEKYRSQQVFVTSQWPGGLYGTPGMSGSRSGIGIASTWISMMKMGVKGYTQNAKQVQNAIQKVVEELPKLGFRIYGKPEICVFGFYHPDYPVSSIQIHMKKRGWNIVYIQKPMGLHYSFTPLNSKKIDQMIEDFRQTIKELAQLKVKGELPKDNAELQLYGACAKIGDGPTKELIINTLVDCFIDI